MSENPTAAAFARLRTQIDGLQDALATQRRITHESMSELAIWKARCYPTPTDVATAKVTRAHAEAWMDQEFVRVNVDRSPATGLPEPRWRDPENPGPLCVAVWRSTDHEHQREIAALIEWAADGQGRDQWQVLAQMASMDNGASLVAQRALMRPRELSPAEARSPRPMMFRRGYRSRMEGDERIVPDDLRDVLSGVIRYEDCWLAGYDHAAAAMEVST